MKSSYAPFFRHVSLFHSMNDSTWLHARTIMRLAYERALQIPFDGSTPPDLGSSSPPLSTHPHLHIAVFYPTHDILPHLFFRSSPYINLESSRLSRILQHIAGWAPPKELSYSASCNSSSLPTFPDHRSRTHASQRSTDHSPAHPSTFTSELIPPAPPSSPSPPPPPAVSASPPLTTSRPKSTHPIAPNQTFSVPLSIKPISTLHLSPMLPLEKPLLRPNPLIAIPVHCSVENADTASLIEDREDDYIHPVHVPGPPETPEENYLSITECIDNRMQPLITLYDYGGIVLMSNPANFSEPLKQDLTSN